ncbi:MAG: hypothetical protein JW827_09320 [Spirochaetes bacterium]|nr:hypothetical protein [Spirochaetota bacterium]
MSRDDRLKIVIGTLIIGLFLFPVVSSAQWYTGAAPFNTTLSNYAIITGANFSLQADNTKTNVLKIGGGAWISWDDIASAGAGSIQSNDTTLTNLGNDTFAFAIWVTNSLRSANNAGPWSWAVLTNSSIMASGTSNQYCGLLRLQRNANKRVVLRVTTSGLAPDTSWEEWSMVAIPTNIHQNTASYVGDNGNTYGGRLGTYVGVANSVAWTYDADAGNDKYTWRITISGPDIRIAKTIRGIKAQAAGIVGAIPGATITNIIYVTNLGGQANTVLVKDFYNTNYVVQGAFLEEASGGTSPNVGTWTKSSNYAARVVQWSNAGPWGGGGTRWTTLRFNVVIK